MKRRYVEASDEATTDKLTDYIGFIDYDGEKSAIVRITHDKYAPVVFTGFWDILGKDIADVVQRLKNGKYVDTIYCFDSASELRKWLAE